MVRATVILALFIIGAVVMAKPTSDYNEEIKEALELCSASDGHMIQDKAEKCGKYRCILDDGSEWPDFSVTPKC